MGFPTGLETVTEDQGLSQGRRKLLLRLQRRKTRVREGLVVVEGGKAAQDALRLGARGRFLVRSPRGEGQWTPELRDAVAAAGLEVVEVDEGTMEDVANTETPQGILLVAEEPAPDPGLVWNARLPRILLLDGIQDPGNAGTLVRAAAAFGCSAVVALPGTTDLWSSRAVRAAAGTGFALPLLHQSWEEADGHLEASGLPLMVADAHGTPAGSLAAPDRWVLAVGSEGAGCRDEVLRRSRVRISIPMKGGVESLNAGVAGAILLFELTRGTTR